MPSPSLLCLLLKAVLGSTATAAVAFAIGRATAGHAGRVVVVGWTTTTTTTSTGRRTALPPPTSVDSPLSSTSLSPPRRRRGGLWNIFDAAAQPSAWTSTFNGDDETGGLLCGDDGAGADEVLPPSPAGSSADADPSSSSSVVDVVSSYVTSSPASSLLGVKSLGVDFGLVRTGLAVTVGYSPHPLAILSDLNETEAASEVIRNAEVEGASRIVVGLPLHKNGTESERSELTRRFATKLACAAYGHFGPDFVVHLWDERYTSKLAAARAMASNPKIQDMYGSLDADAACIILEHYYTDAAEGAERVEVPQDAREWVEAAWFARREEAESAQRQADERRREGLDARKMAMERAAAMERAMAERGELGTSRKKAKKKKKKAKKKRKKGGGDWLVM